MCPVEIRDTGIVDDGKEKSRLLTFENGMHHGGEKLPDGVLWVFTNNRKTTVFVDPDYQAIIHEPSFETIVKFTRTQYGGWIISLSGDKASAKMSKGCDDNSTTLEITHRKSLKSASHIIP